MIKSVSPGALADVQALIGQQIGPTDWIAVTQESVNLFAEATGDHQWIHVDVERAADGPFGTTVAHGLFSLSLAPRMSAALIDHAAFAHALNYGYDRIRFPAPAPAPVPVGCRLRMRITILAADLAADGGIQMRTQQTIEREGSAKPVMVGESLSRLYPATVETS